MIYCIWFPSGGFGHFIVNILSLYGKNFARPRTNNIIFGKNGNSHQIDLAVPRYHSNADSYNFDFDPDINYAVLIDNGINTESTKFTKFFPTAKKIKVCYTDDSWPIVARTVIDKVIRTDIENELVVSPARWKEKKPWAQREKYFLYLRDHPNRYCWKPVHNIETLLINDIINYHQFVQKLNGFGVELDNFFEIWTQWRKVNAVYIDPIQQSQTVINNIKNKTNINLEHITDLWSQAVLYYFLWLEFKQEVPHNDFADFFSCTDQIREWLKI